MARLLGRWGLAKLTDPLGLTIIGELSKVWMPGEKNALVVGPQMSVLSNRLAWLGVALGVLALTYRRFRFAHIADDGRRGVRRRAGARHPAADAATKSESAPAARAVAAAPYLRMQRVRSGEQRLTLTTTWEPALAGIDPRKLLIDLEAGDNLAEVTSNIR